MSKQFKEQLLHIATIGKTVGINGDMKFHIKCDFPEQFYNGAEVFTNLNKKIVLKDVNLDRGIIKIAGVHTLEDAKRFTNVKLLTTKEETRKNCHLDDDEYFWFDLEDCKVFEKDELLGVVQEVQRIAISNYLIIKTSDDLVKNGYSKKFLLPFEKPFKVAVNIKDKTIIVDGAKDILEAS